MADGETPTSQTAPPPRPAQADPAPAPGRAAGRRAPEARAAGGRAAGGRAAGARGRSSAVEVEVAGRQVRLSSPDKVVFPRPGYTKRDVFEYYLAVGDGI
ncbi:MAG TPA: hypothetical protein VFO77_01200, partial [Actinoplanes sp.]|nr:hypothetical protein [Actinoplanes sp.]